MTTVMQNRILGAFSAPYGVMRSNPIIEAAMLWGPDGDTADLREWLADPTTKRMIALVQELAVNPPTTHVGADKIENYGLTSGLQLAVQVLSDPTMLFPLVFAISEQTALPATDYSTEPGA